MTNEQRKQWLATLNIGDEVAFRAGFENSWYLATIDRITPTRRFFCGGRQFDNNGRCRGDNYGAASIEPVTQEVRDAVRNRKIVRRLRDVVWSNLSLDSLRRIVAILDEEKVKP